MMLLGSRHVGTVEKGSWGRREVADDAACSQRCTGHKAKARAKRERTKAERSGDDHRADAIASSSVHPAVGPLVRCAFDAWGACLSPG